MANSWGKVEFNELKVLQARIENYLANENLLEDVARLLAARLLDKVIRRTPVDEGDLRRGWTSESHEEAVSGRSTGDVASYVDSLTIIKSGDHVLVVVSNPVEYASYVELGHRTRNHKGWVRGRHFLRISVNELNHEKDSIVEKIVLEQLKEIFIW